MIQGSTAAKISNENRHDLLNTGPFFATFSNLGGLPEINRPFSLSFSNSRGFVGNK